MQSNDLITVCGAGGFIGAHLVRFLHAQGGCHLRAVDLKPPSRWEQPPPAGVEIIQADLRKDDACRRAVEGAQEVYNLAADMGGMGFIETHKTDCMLNVLINTHLLLHAKAAGVSRYFFASSACVYAADKQLTTTPAPLKESDAYPAMPEDGYGWEKLFGERLCRHYREDHGLATRIGRYHNVYGPHGTFDGGREKAPAAICRKVAEAVISGHKEIEIWGDGEQTRSFTYIDDCLTGTHRLMNGEFAEPLNIGSSELVSINTLVGLVEDIAGTRLTRRYKPDAPLGVRGRNSDNTLVQSVLGWAPSTRLSDGLAATYRWIHDQVARRRKA